MERRDPKVLPPLSLCRSLCIVSRVYFDLAGPRKVQKCIVEPKAGATLEAQLGSAKNKSKFGFASLGLLDKENLSFSKLGAFTRKLRLITFN